MADLVTLDDIETAAARIAGGVVRTPTVHSPGLAARLGAPVLLKLEQLQRSGSFKPRGVLAKLATLSDDERAAGLVAVSGGNHGLAVADVAGAAGIAAVVVMPENAPARSVSAARAAGADVRLTPDIPAAFALAAELQAAGMTLVHPFDDPVTLAAQGTVGLELARDAIALGEPPTDVLVSVGGGALLSGVAVAVRALLPGTRVWGVETVGAEAMSAALAAGGPTPVTITSAVTTLSAPSASQLTYDHVRELVHNVLVVPDADAARGSVELAEHAGIWAEPAAGCLVPAARTILESHPGAHLALVICGRNADVPG
ncbi:MULTISPECIES: pyridoxal-phosphate dependent enzyme [Pseudonocardia]|uniref:Phenylserine dehydratase n=2 Tax=Pseudonocardia TaxID=1847 RepID=A0A1Y2MVR5_PSEAH|nr:MULTISPECIES: pyridoxal-phosphate dependent enzyme [Pseudonocardia]OSY39280.1 Phenylserine dehydratase [Pseudonocardia autotrophica]TDN76498.1 L-threonine ammonia-lyase [Pseudonocardia autotrophica]BBG00498.1 serine/threonine dehydratase [Pseudonocardia autotrophica]GEC26458.1 serine/threonine dehydratase [Pseudonocardia saturnea]